jgi:hypothetical protein
MLMGRRLAGCGLFFLAALISTVSAATDDGVRVEVERPRLGSYKVQSPTINAGLKLTFHARFTNQGDAPVEIPDRVWAGDLAGISTWGVESQQSDGSWRIVEGGGDLLWKGETVFPKCKLLNPKETLEVKEISEPFVVFKSHLDGLWGTTATLKLTLLLPCAQRDRKQVLKTVKTNPFVLSIPPLP